MKCLETRKRDGMKWRRYRTDDGRTVTTFELPVTVLKGVTTSDRLQLRLAKFARGEIRRARQTAVENALIKGTKPLAIADELGLSVREVERRRKVMRG